MLSKAQSTENIKLHKKNKNNNDLTQFCNFHIHDFID